ncbi:MAG: ATP-dependent sacrificial sulfur transferase LarE [Candidatus Desulforudis sp.]|nr:ATP-dependent sacrificial sulfur transferase LarE [Desulforudis sp.]
MSSANEEPVRAVIRKMPGAVVAFSGGVDSAVVLRLACEELGDRVVAVTATGVIYSRADLEQARAFAADLRVRHLEFPAGHFNQPQIRANSPERCYHCKSVLFGHLRSVAGSENLGGIIDGTNAGDAREYRPGLRAAREAGVISPLLRAGLTKPRVRALARSLGLAFWNRPSESCLATRIPYGEPLTPERLEQVRAGEDFLRELGYGTVRLRHHGPLARIEVAPSELPRLVAPPHRELILVRLSALGFRFVTSDIAGYQSGCFDGDA